jgi:S1-C subfamily serine protease
MLGFLVGTGLALGASTGWEQTLDRVVPAVVVIRNYSPRSFDTESAHPSVATGFVVDRERGIILSNRHVVGPGPTVAEAHFQDNEEIPLQAIYRDPVHDFGFYRFDPEAVRFMDVVELQLAPSAVRVGAEIRLVGNDSGEKISILDGTLARIDRAAPSYGLGRFNDFNTFYFQAASGSSGGSSGSPVIDVRGRVIALNAGSKRRTASSFFLPLDRVVRALEKIQAGEPVTRGTLQTTFSHKTFDEVRRLGLPEAVEAEFRSQFPGASGLLTVRDVLPGGPAEGKLMPGDVIVSLNGEMVTGFVDLEAVLDESVGQGIQMGIARGGVAKEVELTVGDLHRITPDEYMEIGGGIVHPLSYQMARHYAVPVQGLMLAGQGYMFARSLVPRKAVIVTVDGQSVPTLQALEDVLVQIPDGARFNIRYFRPHESRRMEVGSLTMDRRWFPMRRCKRDDATGRWPCKDSAKPPPRASLQPRNTTPFPMSDKAGKRLSPSMVLVSFSVPIRTDGVQGRRFKGAGVVVDAERGLVICDRDTVPVLLGDLRLTFGGSVEVPGEVVALHPAHNLALVSYDPSHLGETEVRAATFLDKALHRGDKIVHLGVQSNGGLETREVTVEDVDAIWVPFPAVPEFHAEFYEVVALRDPPSSVGGVLADKSGRIYATWASFPDHSDRDGDSWFRGIPSRLISDMIEDFGEGGVRSWRGLGVVWGRLSSRDARAQGLPDAVAARLEAANPERRKVLSVWSIAPEAPGSGALQEGDILVTVNGAPVVRLDDLEAISQQEHLDLVMIRQGKPVSLRVRTMARGPDGTERVILFGGAVLQAPHYPLARLHQQDLTGVYVGSAWKGSPAGRYRIQATWRILEVDGLATPDLDAFVQAVEGKVDGQALRLRMVDMEGRERARTMKLDLEYWPTEEVVRTPDGWVRRAL